MTGYVPKFATFAVAAFVHTAAFAALMDGSYVASAPGVWGSPVETTVVVKQGKIADVSFKHNETEGVGSRALDVIARSVVKTQSLAVDVVSGATASSKAALMALSVALQKAGYQASNGVKNTVQTAFGDASTDVVVVGGGPGGVAFGLKLAFGDHVHCFFAEPTHSPCMLLGVHTGLHDQISVQDIGIDNLTAADGLAVGRASGFVGRAMERLLDGFYTLSDQTMYDMLGWLAQEEGIRLEPSALAGMAGPQRVCASVSYQQMHGFSAEQLRNTTHLVWATGGGMVPEEEMNQYLSKGR